MATTTPPSISGLPLPPDPNDRSTFNTRAYPWAAALPTLATEIAAVAANVKANADDAKVNADIAVAQVPLATAQVALATAQAGLSQQAAMSAGSIAWVSGTTYAVGDLRYSPIDFQNYRRIVAGAGATDPSADATNWTKAVPSVQDYQEFLTSGTWTKPTNANWVYVEAIGGGGGGASNATTSPATGGSGGEFISKIFRAADVASTVSVVVGAGGAGGAGNGIANLGVVGGATVFTGYFSAFGGNPGRTTAANTFATVPRSLAAVGTLVLEDFVLPQAGHGSRTISAGGNTIYGGAGGGGAGVAATAGGVSELGGNGGAGSITAVGGGGVQPGGGGGGANVSRAGGAGGSGRVRVWAW